MRWKLGGPYVDDERNVHEGRYAHRMAGIARQRGTRHWHVRSRYLASPGTKMFPQSCKKDNLVRFPLPQSVAQM